MPMISTARGAGRNGGILSQIEAKKHAGQRAGWVGGVVRFLQKSQGGQSVPFRLPSRGALAGCVNSVRGQRQHAGVARRRRQCERGWRPRQAVESGRGILGDGRSAIAQRVEHLRPTTVAEQSGRGAGGSPAWSEAGRRDASRGRREARWRMTTMLARGERGPKVGD